MRVLSLVVVVALLPFVAGCQTGSAPPEGGVKAERKILPAWTEFEWRVTDDAGDTRSITYTRLADESSYNGEPAVRWVEGTRSRSRNGDYGKVYVSRRDTGNRVAVIGEDGEPEVTISPSDEEMQWPLWVGKEWTARYRYEDHSSDRSWDPIVTYWEVEAYEEVTVPAGTFKAFRIRSIPGKNNATEVTQWYAPEPGLDVKRIHMRTKNHYKGAGKFVGEAVRIRMPGSRDTP